MMTEEQHSVIVAQLASNETEHKSFRRRLDEHDESLKRYGEILVIMERQSNAIEHMGQALQQVKSTVTSVDMRVAALEKEPGEKWKRITWEIVKTVVVALVGLAVGLILKTPGG